MHVVIKVTITTAEMLNSFDSLSVICYSPVSRVCFPYLTMKLFRRLAVLKQLACDCIMTWMFPSVPSFTDIKKLQHLYNKGEIFDFIQIYNHK